MPSIKISLFLIIVFYSLNTHAQSPIRAGIFIGTNEGHYFDEPLFYAENDAEKIRDVFLMYGGLKEEFSILLKNANSYLVMEKINELKERIKIVRTLKEAKVECIFYYSGHGGLDGLHLNNQTLSYKSLHNALKNLECDLHIMILDSCNSGQILGLKGVKFKKETRIEINSDEHGEVIITSSALNEYSQEKDDFRGAVFTHFFANGLIGEADFNRDSIVTLSEAYSYAHKNTLKETFGTNIQHPSYKFNIKGQTDISLSMLSKPEGNVLISAEQAGYYTFLDVNRGIVFGDFKIKDKSRYVSLPHGEYLVRFQGLTKESQITQISVNNNKVDLGKVKFKKLLAINDPIKGRRDLKTYSVSLISGIEQGFVGQSRDVITSFLYGVEIGFSVDGIILPHQTIGAHIGILNGKKEETIFDNLIKTNTYIYDLGADLGFIWNLSQLIDIATNVSFGVMLVDWQRESYQFTDHAFTTGFNGSFSISNRITLKKYFRIILPAIKGVLRGYKESEDFKYLFNSGVFGGIEILL